MGHFDTPWSTSQSLLDVDHNGWHNAASEILAVPPGAADLPWVSVKDYGAIGDGVADDTAEIQAAIDATARVGVIFFPAGNYKITSALNVGGTTGFGQEIRGAYAAFGGADSAISTTIVQHTLSAKILNVISTSGYSNSLYVRDIKLMHVSDATSGGHGIYNNPGGWTTGITLENVQIANSDIGARIQDIVQPIFRNVAFHNTQTCAVDLVDGSNLPTFENCYFQAGDGDGLRVSALTYDLKMTGCVSESNVGADIRIAVGASLRGMHLDSCWFEFPSAEGMIRVDGQLASGSGRAWVFTNCYFDGSGNTRDVINNTQGWSSYGIVSGLTFTGCQFNGMNGGKILKIAQPITTGSADAGYGSVAFINCAGDASWSPSAALEGIHAPATGGSSVIFIGNAGPRPSNLAPSYGGQLPHYVSFDHSGVTNYHHAAALKANGWWQGSVEATADLPAAASAMDGSILIEDAGAGDRNLIIYAGGQRFRLYGGDAF